MVSWPLPGCANRPSVWHQRTAPQSRRGRIAAHGELDVRGCVSRSRACAEPDGRRGLLERCPSGALSYTDKAGTPEQPAAENTAQVVYNGPLYLSGELEIEGAPEDMPAVRFRAALCRCGASKNKPFCDNSHVAAGFTDYGAVGKTGPGLETTGGPLKVRPMPDGPLKVEGNLTLRAASGRIAWQGTKTVLCRCGLSKNKPFCDGAHREAGFKSD